QFKPTTRAATARCPLDALFGDMAYDAEHNHAYGREKLGIRSKVFPLNRRNGGGRPAKTTDPPPTKKRGRRPRRPRRAPRGGVRGRERRVYGQRWQVESGFSRQERLLGSALRARKWPSQKKEILLRVLTHNLMLLAASQ